MVISINYLAWDFPPARPASLGEAGEADQPCLRRQALAENIYVERFRQLFVNLFPGF